MLRQMFIALIGLVVIASQVYAVQNRPTIEERLIRLEEGQKALNQRIDDLIVSIDRRFEAVDKRFEAVDKRFDDLTATMRFWFQTMTIILVAVFSGIIAQLVFFWQRMGVAKTETRADEHLAETKKDKVIALYREEVDGLKKRVARLEGAMAA